jgi:AcrR family transcriptional regulator
MPARTKPARAERRTGRAAPATRRRGAWRKDPEGRRTRILDAAARLFGRDGYRGVRTEAIAAAAGVSEGTVFHHFGSKDALLVAVAGRYGRGFAAAMFADLDAEGPLPDPEQVMRRAFAYVRHSDPLFGIFILTDDPTDAEQARRANRDEIVRVLTGFLERWRARGLIRPLPPRVVAELLFGLVESALKECFVRGRRARRAERADEEVYLREVVHAIRGMLLPVAPVP